MSDKKIDKTVQLHDLEASANEAKLRGGKGFSKALSALGLKGSVINPGSLDPRGVNITQTPLVNPSA